jgi:hypothetical protein
MEELMATKTTQPTPEPTRATAPESPAETPVVDNAHLPDEELARLAEQAKEEARQQQPVDLTHDINQNVPLPGTPRMNLYEATGIDSQDAALMADFELQKKPWKGTKELQEAIGGKAIKTVHVVGTADFWERVCRSIKVRQPARAGGPLRTSSGNVEVQYWKQPNQQGIEGGAPRSITKMGVWIENETGGFRYIEDALVEDLDLSDKLTTEEVTS